MFAVPVSGEKQSLVYISLSTEIWHCLNSNLGEFEPVNIIFIPFTLHYCHP